MMPNSGDIYQSKTHSGKVRVCYVKRAPEPFADKNKEFRWEVGFIYLSDGKYTDMPLPWFNEKYIKIELPSFNFDALSPKRDSYYVQDKEKRIIDGFEQKEKDKDDYSRYL